MQDILMEAKEDTDYKLVCAALHEGKTIEQVKAFPSSHPARQLSSVWSRLSLLDEDRPSATVVLVDGDKIYLLFFETLLLLSSQI